MRLLVVADLHYALKQYDWLLDAAPDFDAVVIAGDLLEIASMVDIDAQIVVVRTYLRKLTERTRLFVCSGNHDLDGAAEGEERLARWLTDLAGAGLIADGECVRLDGLRVSVFPWWDGPGTREAIARQLERDAQDGGDLPWLWVYHAPPSDSATSWGGSRHFGDPALGDWIARYRPSIVLSGHVHQAPFIGQGAWADRIGDSWVFNMGQQPGEMPAHIILDTGLGKAMWHSIAGTETLDLHAPGARPEPAQGVPDWL